MHHQIRTHSNSKVGYTVQRYPRLNDVFHRSMRASVKKCTFTSTRYDNPLWSSTPDKPIRDETDDKSEVKLKWLILNTREWSELWEFISCSSVHRKLRLSNDKTLKNDSYVGQVNNLKMVTNMWVHLYVYCFINLDTADLYRNFAVCPGHKLFFF